MLCVSSCWWCFDFSTFANQKHSSAGGGSRVYVTARCWGAPHGFGFSGYNGGSEVGELGKLEVRVLEGAATGVVAGAGACAAGGVGSAAVH